MDEKKPEITKDEEEGDNVDAIPGPVEGTAGPGNSSSQGQPPPPTLQQQQGQGGQQQPPPQQQQQQPPQGPQQLSDQKRQHIVMKL